MAGTTYQVNTETASANIAASASASAEITLGGLQILGLELPAAFEATTTAILFKVGMTSGALEYLRDKDGTSIYVTVAATNTNKRCNLDPAAVAGWNYAQLVATTGAAAAPTAVVQTAVRTINLVLGKVV